MYSYSVALEARAAATDAALQALRDILQDATVSGGSGRDSWSVRLPVTSETPLSAIEAVSRGGVIVSNAANAVGLPVGEFVRCRADPDDQAL